MTYILIPYIFISVRGSRARAVRPGEGAHHDSASVFETLKTVVWPLALQGTSIGLTLEFLLAVADIATAVPPATSTASALPI